MTIKGDDFLKIGWREGPELGEAIRSAREAMRMREEAGLSRETALSLTLADLPAPPNYPDLIGMRPASERAPLSMAIRAENGLEQDNLAKCQANMYEVAQLPVVTRTALMPDACPAGPGVCVGGVVETQDAVIPAMHSADMCCSVMATFFIPPPLMGVKELMDKLQAATHFGVGGRTREDQADFRRYEDWKPLFERNPFLKGLEGKAREFLATCGDGNHFNYLGKMKISDGVLKSLRGFGYKRFADDLEAFQMPEVLAIVSHFGSRGVGAEVFRRGEEAARKETAKIASGIPSWGHWIPSTSPYFPQYWEAVNFIEDWTAANHDELRNRFLISVLGEGRHYRKVTLFNAHNFIWKRGKGNRTVIHGKGATPAWKHTLGEPALGIIPLNMAEPILLVAGKDNQEFLSMAPHGAGRNMSRSALMKRSGLEASVERSINHELTSNWGQAVSDETRAYIRRTAVQSMVNNQTSGLDVRWYSGKPDLSETPMAYKNAAAVRQQIDEFDLATVWGEIEPLGCIMAGESEVPFWKRKKTRA